MNRPDRDIIERGGKQPTIAPPAPTGTSKPPAPPVGSGGTAPLAHSTDDVVVLKRRSYNAARERQRVAEALLKNELEHEEHVRRWAQEAFAREREAVARCSYLYALAMSLGATREQLSGPHD